MASEIHSLFHEGGFDAAAVASAATRLNAVQKSTAQCAFAFVSSDYLPHIEEFCDILRIEGRIVDISGCTGGGLVGARKEIEKARGFSLLAISAPDSRIDILELPAEKSTPADPVHSRICLLNPFHLQADAWLLDWNMDHPGAAIVGGLASGTGDAETTAVFHNGRIVESGLLIEFSEGTLRVHPTISQGCRPIGELLTVTRAENNIVFALGAQPAYEALETAFQSLSEEEKATARGNLFVGLASTEYLEDYRSGDFLIRNILGADPNSGAVVIGGAPRIGQTLQYQYRDRKAASADLQNVLSATKLLIPNAKATLAFPCAARGSTFFQQKNHDISALRDTFGDIPHAGFFCNGEIGPVHSVNSLTSFSAAFGFFYDEK